MQAENQQIVHTHKVIFNQWRCIHMSVKQSSNVSFITIHLLIVNHISDQDIKRTEPCSDLETTIYVTVVLHLLNTHKLIDQIISKSKERNYCL